MQDLGDHPILLVDDERLNLELIERFLRRKYKKLILADDGEQALWILETQGVDLVVADQRMPKMDGTDLLHQARELQPNAVRVLMTGYGDVETLTQAINAASVFQVVTKPIDFKILDMVIQRGLEAHEAQLREKAMFDAFVSASVQAIEQRDPSTAGHSYRVATMTTRLASQVDKIGDGPLAEVRFNREELEQLKYASLLHDFGKIGVPEAILTKSHKLPPERSQLLRQRIGHDLEKARIDEVRAKRALELITLLNTPTISASAHKAELDELKETGLLEPEEMAYLHIERGSLSDEERAAIQSHVLGTISFLSSIPWPRRLVRVPEIAGAHHEKMNGTGYPYGISDIPVESRMLTVCDIYDALVAPDRPYKTAASTERALELLGELAKRGEIDPQLVDVFIQARVFRYASTGKSAIRTVD